MSTPTTIPAACLTLAGGISLERQEALREIGPMMLDALVSQGLANHRSGRYAISDAGRRAAAEAEQPQKVE
jgi:hypothetical protein